jgi:hypothetical protein
LQNLAAGVLDQLPRLDDKSVMFRVHRPPLPSIRTALRRRPINGCDAPYGRVSAAAARISPSFNLNTTGKTGIRFRRGGAGNRNFAARQRLTERCGRLGRIEAKRLFSFVPAPYGQGDAAKRARCSEYGIFNVTAFGITPE